MQITQVKIKELISADYNPRKWEEKDIEDLKQSIQTFGIVDPIIANSAEGRKNIVIGGHFRLKIAGMLGYEDVPVVYVNLPDIEKEKELNLRLNKNLGKWDYELLASFDKEMLIGIGFDSDELLMNFGLNEADNADIDAERFNVITVEPPEAPRLKERRSFYCNSIEEYEAIKKAFQKNEDSAELDLSKLLELIQ